MKKGGDDVDIIRQGWDDGCGSFILITDGLRGGGGTRVTAAGFVHDHSILSQEISNNFDVF